MPRPNKQTRMQTDVVPAPFSSYMQTPPLHVRATKIGTNDIKDHTSGDQKTRWSKQCHNIYKDSSLGWTSCICDDNESNAQTSTRNADEAALPAMYMQQYVAHQTMQA